MFKSLAAALTIIPLVAGQSGPQAKRIPKCILNECEHEAIPASGCTGPDQLCHCVEQKPLMEVMIPCAIRECPTIQDLYFFEYLFNDVCKKYGYFIPQNSTNPAEFSRNNKISSATPTPTPTPSLTPGYPGETSSPAPAEYTGAAVSNTKSTDVGFYALLSLLFAGAVAV